MKCFMCKGQIIDKTTTYMAEIENCIIIIKKVPSQVCNQCGEISYNHDTALRLEKMIIALRSSFSEITVANYIHEVA